MTMRLIAVFVLAVQGQLLAVPGNKKQLRIGIVSDVHVNFDYDADVISGKACIVDEGQRDQKAPKALLGRVGCDAPESLVSTMFQLIKKQSESDPLDLIILNGDLAGHHVAQRTEDDVTPAAMKKMSRCLKKVSGLFQEHLEGIPVLITQGNNDFYLHDSAPYDSPDGKFKASKFLNQTHKLFFKDISANKKLAESVKETYMTGGYYRTQLTDNINLISLNSIAFSMSMKTEKARKAALKQLKWLERQLAEEDQSFILTMHFNAGVNLDLDLPDGKLLKTWFDEYSKLYLDLLKRHRDQVIIELGSHEHWSDLRTLADEDGQFYRNLHVATAITPNHMSLPGFSVLTVDVDEAKPTGLRDTFFDVTKTYGKDKIPALEDLSVHHVDYKRDFGFKDFTSESIAQRLQEMKQGDFTETLRYLVSKIGYDWSDKSSRNIGIDIVAKYKFINEARDSAQPYLCQALHGESKAAMIQCLEESAAAASGTSLLDVTLGRSAEGVQINSYPIVISGLYLIALIAFYGLNQYNSKKLDYTEETQSQEHLLAQELIVAQLLKA